MPIVEVDRGPDGERLAELDGDERGDGDDADLARPVVCVPPVIAAKSSPSHIVPSPDGVPMPKPTTTLELMGL